MSLFTGPSSAQLNVGLTLLRAVVWTIFIAHGAQKLFIHGSEGVTGASGSIGIPMARPVGPAVAVLEFGGGFALVVAWLSKPADRRGLW